MQKQNGRVHRLLLEKSEYHVYLARKSKEQIVVVSILECPPKARSEAVAFSLWSPRKKAARGAQASCLEILFLRTSCGEMALSFRFDSLALLAHDLEFVSGRRKLRACSDLEWVRLGRFVFDPVLRCAR